MVSDLTPDPDLAEVPGSICAACGHAEGDHVEQDAEVPGGTLRRTFCETCEDLHDFVLDPRDA